MAGRSAQFTAVPLFDAHLRFTRLPVGPAMLSNYPDTQAFLTATSAALPAALDDFRYAAAFLRSYSRKSEATFRGYRNEVERLLLWCWTVAEKSVVELKRPDLEQYFDFVHAPPSHWVASAVADRFHARNGDYLHNRNWRPFVVKVSKADRRAQLERGRAPADAGSHSLSHEAMKLCYSALSAFYDYLVDEGYAFGNPIPAIRKQSPYLLKGATRKSIKRLSDLQWECVLASAEAAADGSPDSERALFVVALLKTLYLRVSELSDRPNWSPVWRHFWRDAEGNQWLQVLGKGNKIRDISVPSALFPYIERYRAMRQASEPGFSDGAVLVAKTRGRGGLTSRQLRRVVQQVFDAAYTAMCDQGFSGDAEALREATTHWLRHTGASIDIATRPLKHMADDLGHASMGTTDQVYIQSDMKERAQSGKKRTV